MKRTIISAVIGFFLLFAATAPRSFAQPFESLDIRVELNNDGSARVTQIWDVTGQTGTEWYIPIENLGDMTVRDFSVVDENGVPYTNEGEWDVDRSIDEKRGRCGINRTASGIELCWGKGSYGHHVYEVSYTLTGLVQAYRDFDAFNFMFVNPEMSPSPEKVTLTFHNNTGSGKWTSEEVRVWAFGFFGEINVQDDGTILTTTDGRLGYHEDVIVMARFDKGIFSPTLSHDLPFDDMFQKAMEGSDYGKPYSVVDSLLVYTFLNEDGSAEITEQWNCDANVGIWFIRRNTLRKEKISWSDWKVYVDGKECAFIPRKEWDSEQPQFDRAGKFTMEDRGRKAYEIRWFSPSVDKHTFTIKYHVDDIMKGYKDCDLLYHQFFNANRKGGAHINKVEVLVFNDKITEENTSIVAGGENIDVRQAVVDGLAYIEADGFKWDEDFLKVALRFDKDVFSPKVSVNKEYDTFMAHAMKNEGAYQGYGWGDFLIMVILKIAGLLLVLILFRRRIIKALGLNKRASFYGSTFIKGWYRDAPYDGDLALAYNFLTKGLRYPDDKYSIKNLISAYFLKWVQDGVIQYSPGADSKKPSLVLKTDKLPDGTRANELKLFNMVVAAAGTDRILDPLEFKKYNTSHPSKGWEWNSDVTKIGRKYLNDNNLIKKNRGDQYLTPEGQAQARQIYEVKNYLTDFTLISERDVRDAKLWKQYMVYGALLGITDKVANAFSKLLPGEFEQYIRTMNMSSTNDFSRMLSSTSLLSTSLNPISYLSSGSSYSGSSSSGRGGYSGGGGRSSYGGGGGHSGGGRGGGSR